MYNDNKYIKHIQTLSNTIKHYQTLIYTIKLIKLIQQRENVKSNEMKVS